jgi:hypothetical protein
MSGSVPAGPRVPLNDAAAAAATRRRLAPEPAEAVGPGESADLPPGGRRAGFVRKPFGGREAKLKFPDRPGYHRHWFNDEPGRILRATEAGYEQVIDPRSGKPVCNVVGIGRGGGALTAFLMEIPEEWYREDMQAQDNEVLGLLGQIKSGEYERPAGRDGQLRYAGSTKGDISIATSNRR